MISFKDGLLETVSFTPISLQFPDAWCGHIPFAAWLIQTIEPKVFVELGTHSGNSYFSFCQSASEANLATKCYAVDTWQGDAHAGNYGDEVFSQVNDHNQAHYADFSRLLRMTFDDAPSYFSDGSIDLLHIDGLHTYEAVKHDFETWLPKLAPGAVVLFHDTNERKRDFGVWKLWEELQVRYPNNLEFLHSHGLGVLQLDGATDAKKMPWLDSNSVEQQQLKDYFSALGMRQLERFELSRTKIHAANLNQEAAERDGYIAHANQVVAMIISNYARLKKAVQVLLKGRLHEIMLKVSHQLGQNKSYFPGEYRANATLAHLLDKNAAALLNRKVSHETIDIVIPVYNGLEYLGPLFDSLLKNTACLYRIIVIDDCSQDALVAPLLQRYSAQFEKFVLLKNDTNLGFVGSVNRAVEIVHSDIFVLLNTDTELPPNWLDRLIAPILADTKVASATPFSNSATICSFPNFVEDNDLYLGLSANHIDSAFSDIPLLKEPICLPTGVGFCMAINRRAVQTLGMFDPVYGRGYGEENDWCMRVAAKGYKNILVNNLFVYHKHGGSFPSEERQMLIQKNLEKLTSRYPQYNSLVQSHIKCDPTKQIRQLVKLKLASQCTEHGAVLIIDHNLGGGANHYRMELTKTYLQAGRPVLVFIDNSRSKITCLKVFLDKEEFTLNLEDIQLLDSIFESVHITEVIYNNAVAASNPLKIVELLISIRTKYKCKLITLIHDFYPVCPSYTLLNNEGQYCGVPNDLSICERCLPNIPSRIGAFIFPYITIINWRIIWGNMLSSSDEIRCFSENSKTILLKAYPLVANKIHVVPHTITWDANNKPIIDNESPMHIGIVGSINYAKGLDVVMGLVDVVRKLKENVRITVLGEVDVATPINGLNVTGRYKKDELSRLIEKRGINIFLFPSIWPETFSYVTSELIQMNVPIACFDIGAPADRVRVYKLGFILSSTKSTKILSELHTFYAESKKT